MIDTLSTTSCFQLFLNRATIALKQSASLVYLLLLGNWIGNMHVQYEFQLNL